MNLVDILLLKYPEELQDKKIILQDDGGGAYIKEWNLDNVPRPSAEDLVQWATDLASAYTAQLNTLKFNTKNTELLQQLADIDIKSIRALRTNDTVRLASLEAEAATLRHQLVK